MKYYINPDVKRTERIFSRQGRMGFYRYDMNENPEGLPKEFVDSVLKEITPEFLSTYPEPDPFIYKYAKFIGAQYDNILTTNGSDMAIRYLMEVFGEYGKEVVTAAPSFEMYWVNCSLLGLKHIPVPYEDDMTISAEKIVNAINGNTRIVVLVNPNNPMGNVYTEDELRAVIQQADHVGAIVIVDEAYHYFYPHTFLEYALKRDNVVILRTFSKLFSLAACRLGVIISNPELIKLVKNIRLTFDVNSIALLFGERILEHPEIMKELIAIEAEGKAFILNDLSLHGYEYRRCEGNFVLLKPKHDAHDIERKLREKSKILVHAYSGGLLRSYIRVSIGSVKAMERFLKCFYEADLPQ